MGRFLAKFLYGSQNYNLDTPESDKDWKYVELPSFKELFEDRKLGRQLNENEVVWDVRQFYKQLMKANPNALELLFSKEIVWYDLAFREVCERVRTHYVTSLVRANWKNFFAATKGMAYESLRPGVTPKSVSRYLYLYLFLDGVAQMNGEMSEESWRSDFTELPRFVRLSGFVKPSSFLDMVDWDLFCNVVEEEWDSENVLEMKSDFEQFFQLALTYGGC
jgi:predicted nucleotidyltransferase